MGLSASNGKVMMSDYITFASIQAIRSGTKYELLIGPPSWLETFPDLASFGSSLLLREQFSEALAGKKEWRSWLLLLDKSEKFLGDHDISGKLTRAPVPVKLPDEKLLKAAISAFEKRQTVILKVSQNDNDPYLTLTDIELLQEL